MKTMIAMVALLMLSTSVDARTRVTVYKRTPVTERAIYQHPFAVDYVLRSLLCAFHVFSIGPQGKPGSCIDHLRYPAHHRA